MNFDLLHKELSSSNLEKKQKGDIFERYILEYFKYLLKDKIYKISLWNEWEGNELYSDFGIDIVIETNEHKFYAVQCKYKSDENQKETLHNLSTFTSAMGITFEGKSFERAYICTISKGISVYLEKTITANEKDIRLFDYHYFKKANFDMKTVKKDVDKKKIREYQREAIDEVVSAFKSGESKGMLVMACGTGKTLTSAKIVEELNYNYVLVLVPTIALISQLSEEYDDYISNVNNIIVCSDKTVQGREVNISKSEDTDRIDMSLKELASYRNTEATTEPNEILKWYAKCTEDNINIIFSTYHSLDKIYKAFEEKKDLPIFDLIVCDEAHNTATREETFWADILKEDYIKRKHCLYMTATPKMYENADIEKNDLKAKVTSMNDESIYGKCLYEYPFSKAIKDGFLCDINIAFLNIELNPEEIAEFNEQSFIDHINLQDMKDGLYNFLVGDSYKDHYGETIPKSRVDKIIGFTKKIKHSESFRDELNTDERFTVEHIDGKTPTHKREDRLNWLRDNSKDKDKIKIITNARCLTEGIDVPDVNAVLFSEYKTSNIDIIQAVGRCIRKPNKDKKTGYVILPVVIPKQSNKDAEVWLDDSKFEKVLKNIKKMYGKVLISLKEMGVNIESMVIAKIYENTENTESEHSKKEVEQGYLFKELKEVDVKIIRFSEKEYIDDWTNKLSEILPKVDKIYKENSKPYADEIEKLRKKMSDFTRDNITKDDIKGIIVQHVLLSKILEKVLGEEDFFQKDPISREFEELSNKIFKGEKSKIEQDLLMKLEPAINIIENDPNKKGNRDVAKQEELKKDFFKNLFEGFNKVYTGKGKRDIVYTPREVVRYIVEGTDYLLNEHFGKSYLSEDVHVIDPFGGTGTFFTELLQYTFKREDSTKKKFDDLYLRRLYFNEHDLLAYYMSNLFISREYKLLRNVERSFENGIYCDTLEQLDFDNKNIDDKKNAGLLDFKHNLQNTDRLNTCPEHIREHINTHKLKKENKVKMNVIIGNPPYTAKQQQDTGNENKKYEKLTGLMSKDYGKGGSLQALYVKSIFWSTLRINKRGIISYIVPRAFLDEPTYKGMRKCLQESFSFIYILDGKSRKQGGDSFFENNRTEQVIVFFVKLDNNQNKQAQIFYKSFCDKEGDILKQYAKSKDKLNFCKNNRFLTTEFTELDINYSKCIWLNNRESNFDKFISLSNKKCAFETNSPIFNNHYQPIVTNKDYWCYDHDREILSQKANFFIDTFNQSVNKKEKHKTLPYHTLETLFKNGKTIQFDSSKIITSFYYPFSKTNIYFDKNIINRPGDQKGRYGRNLDKENKVILFENYNQYPYVYSGLSGGMFNGSHLSLYYYDENDKRSSNINAESLELFQKNYNNTSITEEDIFNYIYAVLVSPSYRKEYKTELEEYKAEPRIPFYRNFTEISNLGKKLVNIHIYFEKQRKDSKTNLISTDNECKSMKEVKCQVYADEQKIVLDKYTKFTGIPKEAFIEKNAMFNRVPVTIMGMALYYAKKNVGKDKLHHSEEWRSIYTDADDLKRWHQTTRPYLIDLIPRLITVSIQTTKLKREIAKYTNGSVYKNK